MIGFVAIHPLVEHTYIYEMSKFTCLTWSPDYLRVVLCRWWIFENHHFSPLTRSHTLPV